jgi:hypothetical protein
MDIRLLIGGYLYIAVVVIFGITILIKVIKKRGFTASDTTRSAIIFGIGFLYIIALAFYYSKEIGLSDRLQILLMFGLVAVTAFYAWSAFRQADANVKMAEEMAKKRYSEFQPVLIPKIPTRLGQIPEEDVLYMILASGLGGMEQQTPKGVTIRWHNAGKGVALNAMFSLTGTPLESEPNKARLFTPTPNLRTALKVDEEKEVTFDLEWKAVNMSAGYSPRLEAEYQDIYERKLTTVQEFSFNKGKEKAHLGELYFTVNGRRLGEEVTDHD